MKMWVQCLLLVSLVGCGNGKPTSEQDKSKEDTKSKNAEFVPTPVDDDENQVRDELHSATGIDRARTLRLLRGSVTERLWAVFSLGTQCQRENADETLARIAGAVASWMSEEKLPNAQLLLTAGWAMGACPAPETEAVLRGWLSPNSSVNNSGLTEAGVLGLGALADRQGTLSERTQTAILDAAAREKRSELLFPLGRIGRLSEAVGAHILEVTGSLLTNKEDSGRRHAIFALGSAGPSAAAPLSQIVIAETFTPQERAAAAQALARLGAAGQDALDETLRDILSRGLPVEFDRELWVPLRAMIKGLESVKKSKKQLRELSSVVLSEGEEREKLAQRRRMIWLRCQAARLLAGTRYETPSLIQCDPDQGRDFHLAQLDVLGRKDLKGARKKKLLKALKSQDTVVVQAALRMLAAHPEVTDSAALLGRAFESSAPGTQATAAQVIAAYPSRAHESSDSEGPSDAIIKSLKALLVAEEKDTVPAETRAAAIKAAGALRALSLKPEVETLCAGSTQAMWRPAEQALSLLGEKNPNCPKKAVNTPGTFKKFSGKTTLLVDSDVGPLKLHLDGADAPISAAHVLHNVDQGVYDGMRVHGARAGFALQFGDADGDGYQDQAGPALPHEVAPRPFDALSFGMSAFSPGSQDTHLFVVVSDAPQLLGSRVHLGRAEGPWHLLAVGDVLHSIKRAEASSPP